MNKLFTIVVLVLGLSASAHADVVPSKMKLVVAKEESVSSDLLLILRKAKLDSNKIQFSRSNSPLNQVEIQCQDNQVKLTVMANDEEWSSVFYYGLQKLGFYFPHPRIQISPHEVDLLKSCQKTFKFEPAFKFRGFHLHTLHPNEWVHGFLMGKTEIAMDFVRWMARNYQNIFDLNLVRQKKKRIYRNLKAPFKLAKELGIYPGISLGAALHQQNSFKLLNLLRAVTGVGSQKALKKKLKKVANGIDFSFLTMEAGTSEFTPVAYKRAIGWMEGAASVLNPMERQLFIKVHVSSNQTHPEYGNFNFLPQYTNSTVGIFPHTVMFYGLYDEHVPMYGNENFFEIRDFTLREKSKRPTWYYPETSYFIFMDVDVPLLLTDYLTSRAEDMKNLSLENLEGHINFTTGHELGYWLMDWTVALMSNKEYAFDPMIGLKLLGEDQESWKAIVDFQTKHIKKNGIISMITAANFQDEISKKHRIHDRNLLKELAKNPELNEEEILKLSNAIDELPSTAKIKNKELRDLMDVTFLRIHHARQLRMALRYQKKSPRRAEHIQKAREYRAKAKPLMDTHVNEFERYPKAKVFSKHKNPTSYQLGYGEYAKDLRLWKREEEQVRRNKWNPFFMNIYSIWNIIF
ncbi:MAG: hypothetical protein CME70_11815 [Halobacteriovorax sp.]|nr:hypothetical protein [Halobacteriovorax sp.]|tara:strand:- start:1407 stop:3302 length:1896 start_codon:yes stop_codon:yes gene_type:complete